MKLSFSRSKKPASKQTPKIPNDDETAAQPSFEFVTEFDSTKTLTDSEKKPKIAPLSNVYNPYKKMKNLELPLHQSGPTETQFEVESAEKPADQSNMSYGLNIRNSGNSDTSRVPVDVGLLQKLKRDLRDLPDDPGMDECSEMPVEGFGAALLAGYGWQEGMGIGRSAKNDVKIVQYVRKTAKEGLGFKDMPSVNEKKEKIGNKVRGEGETKEVGRFHVGRDVRVISGREVGLKGRVLKILGGGDSVVLRLSRSEEELKVKINDIADLGSVEEDRCLRKLKELRMQDDSRKNKERSRDKRREGKRERDDERRSEYIKESKATSQVCWLTSHIRVRIISKDFKGGRLYLKKCEVVDVVGPTTCDVCMDESKELVQGVDQEFLETAVPRCGGPVLVLSGKHKGAYGNLVEKDSERERGVVRDADTHAMLTVPFEQLAEYTGDPDLIGY